MAESNKKSGSEINRFLDIYHEQNDDFDVNEDQNVDFDYRLLNFGQNEQLIPAQLESVELSQTNTGAAAGAAAGAAEVNLQEAEEEHLSQQFRQLSASQKQVPASGTKRPVLTPTTPTTPLRTGSVMKKVKTITEPSVFDDAPQYLSTKNKFFERFIVPIIEKSGINLPMESLRSIAILKHKLALVDLNQTLWNIYTQSGTGTLKVNHKHNVPEGQLANWPKEVKTRMMEDHFVNTDDMETIDHATCLSYVNDKLEQLTFQQMTYQDQMEQLKRTIQPHFTSEMEKHIAEFVEQYGIALHRLRIDQEVARIQFDFTDHVLEWEFKLENAFQDHINVFENLTKSHLAKETSKMDVAMLKQRIVQNYLPDNLRTFDLPKLEAFETITDPKMRQRLLERYDKILQRTVSDMMTVQLATMEAHMNENENKFNNDMAKFKSDQVHGPTYKKLTKTMSTIMERYFTNQSQRVLTSYKIQSRFFGKAPTDMN